MCGGWSALCQGDTMVQQPAPRSTEAGASRPGAPPPGHVDTGRLRLAAWATLMALVVQFALGIATTLYVTVPRRHPWTSTHPAALLWAHVVVGVALIGNAFMVLARARASGSPAALAWALIGLVGIIAAAGAGAGFVGGGQSSGASMAMAMGFALAVVAYATVLWKASSPEA